MSSQFTLATFRDAIRRSLNLAVPADFYQTPNDPKFGAPGAEPSWNRIPSNAQINQAVNDAISIINTTCNWRSSSYPLSVAAQTTNGPSIVYMFNANVTDTTDGLPRGSEQTLKQVKSAMWYDGSDVPGTGTAFPLTQVQPDTLNLQNPYYQNTAPGMPTTFWIDGYKMNLLPGSANGGTLVVIAGSALTSMISDNDTFDQCDNDMVTWIRYQTLRVLGVMLSADTEMTARVKAAAALFKEPAEMVAKLYTDRSRLAQTRITYASNRRQTGNMKVRF